MSYIKLFFILFALIVIVSCSAPKLLRTTPVREISVPVVRNNTISFFVEPLTISPYIKNEQIIGEAKVGMFNEDDSISSEYKVSEFMSILFINSLIKAGFKPETKSKASIIISGQVDYFWVDEFATGWHPEYSRAFVQLDVILKNQSGAFLWAGSLVGRKLSKITVADTTAEDIPTLVEAAVLNIESLFDYRDFWESLQSLPVQTMDSHGS